MNNLGERVMLKQIRLALAAITLSAAWGHAKPAFAQSGLADAVENLPDAALWNFKVFFLFPNNVKDYRAACDKATAELKPGETKEFDVIFSMAGDEPVRFIRLEDTAVSVIRPRNQKALASIKLTRSGLASSVPLRPFDEEEFKASIGKRYPRITYDDHKHTIEIWNAQNGLVGGKPRVFIDLLDPTAKSGGEGKVILVGASGQDKYQVLNVSNGKVEEYRKGEMLKNAGNTVWILCHFNDEHEYTLVYHSLAEAPAVAVGTGIKPGDKVGKFSKERAGLMEIWRVKGKEEYFLKNGAYRVAPLIP